MADLDLDPLVRAFYRDRYREDECLTRSGHGRLEFVRTQELLRRHLPPAPATVLDVGGGTGAHARWLAADGHRVHVVDPVPSHVEQAARLPGVSASRGDARALEAADDSVDATLLLGPLYHLVDAADRATALREAVRVTRRGGLVAAAAITRHAALLELTGLGLLDDATLPEVTGLLGTGVNTDDPAGFTTAYVHHVGEFRSEVARCGLTGVTVFGVEGPAAPALDNAAPAVAAAVMASAVRCARLVETDPALIAASPHLLAVGTVP